MTFFVVLSLSVGFLLFGVLQGVDAAFGAALQRQRLDRLLVDSRYGDPPLPLSYADTLLRVPGVMDITWTTFLIGRFGGPKDNLVVVATDPTRFLRVRDEFAATPRDLARLRSTRDGLLVYAPIAARNGWKIGDRITLVSAITPRDGTYRWGFEIVGFLSNPSDPGRVSFALGNYDYFDEMRASNRSTVGRFVIRVSDPARSAEISGAIDRIFANSAAPTRTMSENEVAQSQLAGVGDVRALTRAVIAAVFSAILFLTGNALLQTARERTCEFGALRALGFHSWQVILVVVTEALTICLCAAFLGLLASAAMFPLVAHHLPSLSAYVGVAPFSRSVFVYGLVLAVGLGAASSALPGWFSTRLNIVEALAVARSAQ
jgi:putative ABC transport system permease protein